MMNCPECGSQSVVKNGFSPAGKQKYKCSDCRKQFVLQPERQAVSEERKADVERLLLERISLRGIARSMKISRRWLQNYVNKKCAEIKQEVEVIKKSKCSLIVEMDEIWSYCGNKQQKQWVWLAIDRQTREIVGVHIGDRSREGAIKLWHSLPPVYRQCAVIYSDFWEAYKEVLPKKRHRSVGKESGQTNHIERFNNTLRQRISRLVRKTLSFSKKLENHIGAIWNFVHHYNSLIAQSTIAPQVNSS